MRYHPSEQSCVCPNCGSNHDTVHGFKEHHKDKHGRYPSQTEILRAQANAYTVGDGE